MSVTTANLAFTKLVVNDFEGAIAFYSKSAGLTEALRVEAEMNGRPMVEVIFAPASPGAASLVLLKYTDNEPIGKGQAVLVFMTDDCDGFVQRVAENGGKVCSPPAVFTDTNAKVAFIEDLEGNLVEVAQML